MDDVKLLEYRLVDWGAAAENAGCLLNDVPGGVANIVSYSGGRKD